MKLIKTILQGICTCVFCIPYLFNEHEDNYQDYNEIWFWFKCLIYFCCDFNSFMLSLIDVYKLP